MNNIISELNKKNFPFELNESSIKTLISGDSPEALFNHSLLNMFLIKYNLNNDVNKEIPLPWDFNELETLVKSTESKYIYPWYDEDSTSGNSTSKSKNSFSNYELLPNYLNLDKSVIFNKELKLYSNSLGTTVLNTNNPFFISPFGAPNLYSDNSDEILIAKAAVDNNIVFSIPTLTKYSIEEIQHSIEDKLIKKKSFSVFQLYLTDDNQINISIIERVKCSGISVILLTIDAGAAHGGIKMINTSADITFCSKISGILLSDPVFNKKCYELHNCIGTQDKNVIIKIKELLKLNDDIILNYDLNTAFNYARRIQIKGMSLQNDCDDINNEMYTWSIHNIVNITHSKKKLSKYTLDNEKNFKPIPIIIKGILTIGNARSAINADADGIYITNHGGRFLYNSVSPLDVLSEIKKFVKDINKNIGVWYDGGIRNGNDILIAYAKGADFVGIGRPIIYSAVVMGYFGVSAMIKQLLFFLKQQCILCGINNFEDYNSLLSIIKSEDENIYKNKYLKYKTKYVNGKNIKDIEESEYTEYNTETNKISKNNIFEKTIGNKLSIGKLFAKILLACEIKVFFGVPSDLNMSIIDEMLTEPITFIGMRNELNSSYAAEGFARSKFFGPLFVGNMVGSLSAINGFANSISEKNPILMISGSNNSNDEKEKKLSHHTLFQSNKDQSKSYECFVALCTNKNALKLEYLNSQHIYNIINNISDSLNNYNSVYL